MFEDFPSSLQGWERAVRDADPRAGITQLGHLKDVQDRPTAARHRTKTGRPKKEPIRLSASTAERDDFHFLRALLEPVSANDDLPFLESRGYINEHAWRKSLDFIGLTTDGNDLVSVAVEVVGPKDSRPLGHTPSAKPSSDTPAATMQVETSGLQTPHRQTRDETADAPGAPRKEPTKRDTQFVEGTTDFHNFVEALESEASAKVPFFRTAKCTDYGAFKSPIRMYQDFKLAQDRALAEEDSKAETFLHTRPSGPGQVHQLSLIQRATSAFQDTPSRPPSGPPPTGSTFLPGPAPTGIGYTDDDDDDNQTPDRDELKLKLQDETTVTSFSVGFICEVATIRSQALAYDARTLTPHRFAFIFGRDTEYSVTACVDAGVWRHGFEAPSRGDSPAETVRRLAWTAEFKSTRHQPVMCQVAFQFAARIWTRYGPGGDSPDFQGRRSELCIFQCGTEVGLIVAEYGASWVQYVQDGENAVLPGGCRLAEKDMLILRPLACTALQNKPGLYLWCALLRAILETDASRSEGGDTGDGKGKEQAEKKDDGDGSRDAGAARGRGKGSRGGGGSKRKRARKA